MRRLEELLVSASEDGDVVGGLVEMLENVLVEDGSVGRNPPLPSLCQSPDPKRISTLIV